MLIICLPRHLQTRIKPLSFHKIDLYQSLSALAPLPNNLCSQWYDKPGRLLSSPHRHIYNVNEQLFHVPIGDVFDRMSCSCLRVGAGRVQKMWGTLFCFSQKLFFFLMTGPMISILSWISRTVYLSLTFVYVKPSCLYSSGYRRSLSSCLQKAQLTTYTDWEAPTWGGGEYNNKYLAWISTLCL